MTALIEYLDLMQIFHEINFRIMLAYENKANHGSVINITALLSIILLQDADSERLPPEVYRFIHIYACL